MKPIFVNQNRHIIGEIQKATDTIRVAVAWITDNGIIDALAKKGRQGVKVEILISARMFDEKFKDNQDTIAKYLFISKCKVYKIGAESTDDGPLMHHKFCVVDDHTVISGSYNWTRNATRNDEDIIIGHDKDAIKKYIDRFEEIKEKISVERLWFNDLDLFWQDIFKKALNINHEPTEYELSNIVQITKIDVSAPPLTLREDFEEEYFQELLQLEDNPTEKDKEIYRVIARTGYKTVDDLSPLSFLKRLKILDCSGTDIKSLRPISTLTELEELNIMLIENATLDLNDISNLKSLKVLSCGGTNLKNWEAISALTNLEEIHFSTPVGFQKNDKITTLEPLRPLTKLRHLDINGLQISDLKPLSEHQDLEVIYAEQSLIKHLSALVNLKKLKELDLYGAPITETDLKEFEERNPHYRTNKEEHEIERNIRLTTSTLDNDDLTPY